MCLVFGTLKTRSCIQLCLCQVLFWIDLCNLVFYILNNTRQLLHLLSAIFPENSSAYALEIVQ